MAQSVPDDLKKEIRSVLLSKVGGVCLTDFHRDFKNLIGHKIDLDSLGLKSLRQLICAIPDVARIEVSAKDNKEHVFGLKDPGMFMNRTAMKAQYKPRIVSPVKLSCSDTQKAQWCEDLEPNGQGLFSVCFAHGPSPSTKQEVSDQFSRFGSVADVHFTDRYSFVRFTTCDAALLALDALHSTLGLRVPLERSRRRDESGATQTQVKHDSVSLPDSVDVVGGESPVVVFIGNLSLKTDKSDLEEFLKDFEMLALRVRSKDNKRFAFVEVATEEIASNLIRAKRNALLDGNKLIIRLSTNPSNKTIGMQKFTYDCPQSPARDDLCAASVSGSDFGSACVGGDGGMMMGTVQQQVVDVYNELPPLEEVFDEDELIDRQSPIGQEVQISDSELRLSHQMAAVQLSQEASDTDLDCKQEGGVQLYVANFPYGTSPGELLAFFAPYGAIDVDMKVNEYTPKKRHYAFVRLPNRDVASQALCAVCGAMFKGRRLIVRAAHYKQTSECVVSELAPLTINVSLTGDKSERKVFLNKRKTPPLPQQQQQRQQQRQTPWTLGNMANRRSDDKVVSNHPTDGGGDARLQPQQQQQQQQQQQLKLKSSGMHTGILDNGMLQRMLCDCCPQTQQVTAADLPQCVDVLVCHVQDAHHVWGHICSSHFLASLHWLKKTSETLADESLHGRYYAGLKRCVSLYDGEWYRCWVMDISSNGKMAKVCYIDYGNVEQVPVVALRSIADQFWTMRPIAVPFRIKAGQHELTDMLNQVISVQVIGDRYKPQEYIIDVKVLQVK